ncbi:hypothetical protein FRB95_010299 [Tulasnella sp. JGI-2019a]|nr:hypothetical protein FRB95_010299 [Tulasnella sp. JGI-2019a]
MLAISTWHPSSTVTHSLKCRLAEENESLVIAKVNTLEVHDLNATGLTLRCTFDIWGTVTSLLATQRNGRAYQSLLLTTDHLNPNFYILDYDSSGIQPQLVVSYSLSLSLRAGREAEFFNGAILHPNGKVVVCCAYSGTFKVVVLGENGNVVQSEFDCRVPELNIHAMCFVPSKSKLILAILFEDHNARKHVIARELNLKDQELLYEHSSAIAGGFVQNHATILLPVPGQRKTPGVLVLGGGVAHFIGSERVTAKQPSRQSEAESSLTAVHSLVESKLPLESIGHITFAAIDDTRYLLGDSQGRICLLSVGRKDPSSTVSSINILELGRVSPVSTITHISGPFAYIGSQAGDSQTIHILSDRTEIDGSHIKVLENYVNLGPIMDAILVDVDGSSQNEVITCSGYSTAGSLRMIRSGAELKRLATLQGFPNVEDIFPLRLSLTAIHHALILFSTANDRTTVFEVKATCFDEIPPMDFSGFIRTGKTLAACDTEYQGRAIQVTSTSMVIVDMTSGAEVDRWPPLVGAGTTPAQQITCAAVNPTQVVIALRGGKLMLFSTKTGQLRLVSERLPEAVNGLLNEVSALSIQPTAMGNQASSNMVAVGYWAKNTVALYQLPNIGAPEKSTVPYAFTVHEDHVPVSLLLHTFGDPNAHLIIGLGNGSLASYKIQQDVGLTNRRTINLGIGQPIKLISCHSGEIPNNLGNTGESGNIRGGGRKDKVVLAAGKTACVLWFDKRGNRLRGGTVAIRRSTALCSIDLSTSSRSVLVAAKDGTMTIGRIGELNQLNYRTIQLGLDNPRQIAYHHQYGVFAIGCVRIEAGVLTSFIKILDATTFESRNIIGLHAGEQVTCVRVAALGPSSTPYIIVGTTFDPPADKLESASGRILVLHGGDAYSVNTVTSIDVPGCVYALTGTQSGYLAAAINSRVSVYRLEAPEGKDGFRFATCSTWDRGYVLTSIACKGDMLAVGDALRSVDLLKLEGDKLISVAKNCNPLWPLSVEWTGEDSVISGEGDLNLSLFKHELGDLDRAGGFHYGELVNKFITGSLSSVSPEALIRPELVAVTSTGRISVISQVDEETSLRLTGLQRNLGYIIKGPAGVEHSTYRSPITRQGRGAFAGFIDGDFVERLLDLSEDQVEKAMQGRNEAEHLNADTSDMKQVVEQIGALHP